jgi:hypothetical protein
VLHLAKWIFPNSASPRLVYTSALPDPTIHGMTFDNAQLLNGMIDAEQKNNSPKTLRKYIIRTTVRNHPE